MAPERVSAFDPDRSVVVEELTTATRRVYENVDGSRTAVVSPGAVRFEEGGGWREIDLDLVSAPGGDVVPAASPAGIVVPGDAAEGLAVHESPAGKVTLRVPAVLGTPGEVRVVERPSGPDRVEVWGRPNVGSVVTPLSSGFEQDIVFAARGVAVPSFMVVLEVPAGVTAQQTASGVSLSAGGSVIATYGAGLAYEASEEGAGAETPARTTLVSQGAGLVTAQVAVDAGWLASPDRVFPVTIDPTYTSVVAYTAGGVDTFVNSAAPTTSYPLGELRVGKNSDGAVYRSLIKFGLGVVPSDALVYEAEMRLYQTQSTSCSPVNMNTRGLVAGFTASTTWSTQPSPGTLLSSDAFSAGFTGCPSAWQSIDVTEKTQEWVTSPASNFGVRLQTAEASGTEYKRFRAGESGGATSPHLIVTWERLPPPPPLIAPADGARVATDQPTLSVSPVTDPDGDPVTYWFRLFTGDGPTPTGQLVSSGWISSTDWTPPAGALLDGVSYHWTVYARSGAGWYTEAIAPKGFTVDKRLAGAPAPTESAGPVAVNLVTGDAAYSTGSPSMATLGGGIGLGYSYHSQRRSATGLTGSYWIDDNANAVYDDGNPELVRTDPVVNFDWTNESPHDKLPQDQFLTRWTGFVTVPTTGSYYFGGSLSNGVKITVNNSLVLDRWPNGGTAGPVFDTAVSLTAGQRVPISIDYVDSAGYGSWFNLAVKVGSGGTITDVPSSWLTPSRATTGELSPGWDLDLGAPAIPWDTAEINNDSIVLRGPDGIATEFERTNTEGWLNIDGETDATVAVNTTGAVTVQSGGTTAVFNTDGTLKSATTGEAADSTDPTYTWTSTVASTVIYQRVSTITDPVSQRDIALTWALPGSTCPTAPSGFDSAPPTGALCKVVYWDSTETSYFYKAGQLARIVDPGAQTTDLGYDTNGQLNAVRDPLAHETVARGVRADDATASTIVTYTSGRATKVTQPAPTAGALRPETTFTYGTGTTDVAVTGATGTSGYTRRAGYDSAGRGTAETDALGRTSSIEWNPVVDDEQWATTTPDGLKSTTIYDTDGRPTGTYGPAPAAWYGSDRRPLAAHVADTPHESVAYDEDTRGLSVSWFPNGTLTDAPASTAVGVGTVGGELSGTWATSPAGTMPFSGRFTGDINFASAGTYTFALTKNGKASLWIDDRRVVDGWASSGNAAGTISITAAGWRRIRVDYASPTTGTPALTLAWTPPGSTSQTVPGTSLAPDLDLATSGESGGVDQAVSYTGGGTTPSDGLPAAETVDPGGAGLTTSYSYEPDGTGWKRPLTRTLPAGNTWAYAYYGGTETRDNPCTPASDPASQAGALETRTGPQAADGTTRVEETVYDEAGRVVATRIGSGGWTCTNYDTAGRPTSRDFPAFGGAPARTVTFDGAVGGDPNVRNDGNPLVSLVSDGAGTVVATIDLLGRTVSYEDAWDAVTTTAYDQAGRTTSTTTTVGATSWTTATAYTADSLPDTVSLDGDVIADVAYDALGRTSSVSYPAGTGNAGNGTNLAPLVYDDQGRAPTLTWKAPDGSTLTSDTVTYDTNSRVVDQTIDGHDPTPGGPSFAYDSAGRLTQAVVAVRDPLSGVPTGATRPLGYRFDPAGGCGPLTTAGNNTNRTAATVDGVTTAAYCYDAADRLTTTTQPGYGAVIAYDSRGNTTTIAGETRSYDGDDRHRATTKGTTTVAYTRDATDRIIGRDLNGATVARYVHTGPGDSPTAVTDTSGNLLQRSIGLPGGVTYSDDGSSGDQTWSYPNNHGDIAAIADGAGAKQGPTRTYDPYGNPDTTHPDTAPGNFDWGWLGQHQRPLEHQPGFTPTTEMGARQYDPTLGRFLEIDPVEGGTLTND